MVKYYIAYGAGAENEAVKANSELAANNMSNTAGSALSEIEAVKSADFLFIVVTEKGQVDLPEVRKAWETFDGELRWKRKPHGEIIFLTESEELLDNLPLRLKGCGYFLLSEAEDAAKYCVDKLKEQKKAQQKSKEAAPAVKQIAYIPPAETVKQIEFSVRAPQIGSFDFKKNNARGDSSACRDDHAFDTRPRDDGFEKRTKKKSRSLSGFGIFLFVVACITSVVIACVFGL